MSAKYVFRGSSIGQVGGTIGRGAVQIVATSLSGQEPQTLSKTTLKDGDTITIGDQTIDGPCTVEVRNGTLFVDGKERAPAGAITIVIKSKLDRDLHVGSGRVTVEGDMSGAIHANMGSVTVHGNARNISANMGSVHVGGSVTSATSGMGTVHVGVVKGDVTYL